MGGFDTFEVKTTEGDFEARSVILATEAKELAKIPGVKEFEGKGVSYCAVCDAFSTAEKMWRFLKQRFCPS